MKKILCTLAVVGLAASMYAQGTIAFVNSAATAVKFKPSMTDPDTAAVAAPGTSSFVELLWAPTGTALAAWNPATQNLTQYLAANPGWAALPASIKALGSPGRFNAGEITVPTATPGATIDALVASWGGNAASFDAAYTAGNAVGLSSKFTVATGNPTTTPPGTATSILAGNPPFAGVVGAPVGVIPEPSSFALAGLGAAALLIFRRRN